MRGREPIVPQRRRRIPPQFSWVDHRLVREGHVQGRSAPALALYLFLVTVADAEGLSYYSDLTISRLLPLDGPALDRARQELRAAKRSCNASGGPHASTAPFAFQYPGCVRRHA